MKISRLATPALSTFLCLALAAGAGAQALLRICDDVEQPASLNPYEIFSEKTLTIVQQIMEGLVRFDSEGRLEPALAERWERINDTTMRFHLRKGVDFHNGEPFDSQAVKFSLEGYVAPETAYPGFGFMSTIARVSVVDSHTVDVVTHIPDGLLLNRLAAFGHILPPAYYASAGKKAFGARPVGTGPFKFEKWEDGQSIALAKYENYWMKGHPEISRLVFKFVPWEKQVPQLLQGELDIVTELPGTRTLEVMKNPKTKVIKKETFYVMACSLNASSGPLKDKRLRQAINYALNREDMIRYDVLGNGKIIAGIAMEGEEGFVPDLKPYPYDPGRARALLKEAGYPAGGLKLKIVIKEQGSRLAGIIQKQFDQVGIKADIRFATDSNVMNVVASEPWDLYIGGCPDPMVHSFFIKAVVLHSKSPHSIYKNPEFDRLLENMASTVDTEERVRKAQQIERFVHEEALSLFMYQRIKTYGVNRMVKFVPTITGMSHFFPVQKDAPDAVKN